MAGRFEGIHFFNQTNGLYDDGELSLKEQSAYNAHEARQVGASRPDGRVLLGMGLDRV